MKSLKTFNLDQDVIQIVKKKHNQSQFVCKAVRKLHNKEADFVLRDVPYEEILMHIVARSQTPKHLRAVIMAILEGDE